MGSNYNFRSMKPKAPHFKSARVAATSDRQYQLPRIQLYLPPFKRFCKRYLENFQRDSMLALAVTGIIPDDWHDVYGCAVDGKPPFHDLDRKVFKGEITSPFEYFRGRLAREGKWRIHYPPLCPDWLFAYGVSQENYLYALEEFWQDVDNAYYRPWSSLRFGEDSPEVARIKMLGDVARGEIDEVARQTGLYVQR